MSNANFLPEIGQNFVPSGYRHPAGWVTYVPSGADAAFDRYTATAGGELRPHFSQMMVRQWGHATLGEQKVNGRCHMSKHTMTGVPVCTWIAVKDASGRTHMEARWSVATVAHTAAA